MHFSLLLADRDGCVIDPLAVGVEGLVELMRDRPRVAPDGVVDTGALQADGPAQVLAAVDRLLARVHALRVAAVAAVGEALPVTELDGAVTAEIMAALRVSRRVQAGNLSVNSHSSVRYAAPFGGFKQSGLGRELGPDAVEAFTETKSVFYATRKGQ